MLATIRTFHIISSMSQHFMVWPLCPLASQCWRFTRMFEAWQVLVVSWLFPPSTTNPLKFSASHWFIWFSLFLCLASSTTSWSCAVLGWSTAPKGPRSSPPEIGSAAWCLGRQWHNVTHAQTCRTEHCHYLAPCSASSSFSAVAEAVALPSSSILIVLIVFSMVFALHFLFLFRPCHIQFPSDKSINLQNKPPQSSWVINRVRIQCMRTFFNLFEIWC